MAQRPWRQGPVDNNNAETTNRVGAGPGAMRQVQANNLVPRAMDIS